MLIAWFKFLPALLLLLPPVALFHGKRVHYRAVMRDWDGYWGKTIAHAYHTIDLLRAALGAWLLVESVTLAPGVAGITAYAPLLTQVAVFSAAVALQVFVCKEPEAGNAPFTFVTGLIVGFLSALMPGFGPPLTAAFALMLATVVAAGTHSPAVFFPVGSVAIVGLGLVFMQQKHKLALGVLAIAVGLPWLLTLLFPRHFVVPYRTKAPNVKPKKT